MSGSHTWLRSVEQCKCTATTTTKATKRYYFSVKLFNPEQVFSIALSADAPKRLDSIGGQYKSRAARLVSSLLNLRLTCAQHNGSDFISLSESVNSEILAGLEEEQPRKEKRAEAAEMMSSLHRFQIICCVAVVLLVQNASGSMSRPPRGENINNVVDALKYLQDLDEFYGDKARPRFGKRLFNIPQSWRDRLVSTVDMVKKPSTGPTENADFNSLTYYPRSDYYSPMEGPF